MHIDRNGAVKEALLTGRQKMSLPLEARTVAGCKFLYMFLKSLPWHLNIAVSMLIGYSMYAKPPVGIYPLWLMLSLFLPVIPMLAAAFLGFLIARISTGFRKIHLVQTVLTLVFILFCFSLRFIIKDVFRNDRVQATLETALHMTRHASEIYLPAGWFTDAVTKLNIPAMLLLAGVSAALFGLVFAIVGRSYRQINSALKSHATSGRYRMRIQRQSSPVVAIAFKEYRRFIGSTTYMVNGGIGVILAAMLGMLSLIIGPDRIIAIFAQGAPVDSAMLRPAIPFIVYFFIGMFATAACSPSLEGKNYWIVQSLPIEKRTLYLGKMLFNLALTVPFMTFSTVCLCVAVGVPVPDTALYLLLGLVLCAFSTVWGCVCGIRHMRLDWENEIEVIKQGAAVVIYMFPNMFAVIGLTVLVVLLGTRMDHRLLTAAGIVIASALASLSYAQVLRMTRRL